MVNPLRRTSPIGKLWNALGRSAWPWQRRSLIAILALAALLLAPWAVEAQSGPDAPGNLAADIVEGRGVALSWDAPTEDAESVTGYQILRRLPQQGEQRPTVYVADTGSTNTSYTDEDATVAGEQYNYRVKALRGDQKSGTSNLAKVTLPQAEPDPTPEPTDATIKELTLTDATIKELTLTDANGASIVLTPIFDPLVDTYEASVSNGVASISVAATKNYSGATLEFINRVDAIQTGATSEVEYTLDVGDNLIEVEVTSASGNELKTYTVTVTRAASDDATLSSLELQDASGAAIELIPDFDPATTEYSVSVPNGVESVTLTTEKNHGGASAAILTPSGTSEPDEATVDLSLGSNVLSVVVTAEDSNAVVTYTVSVERAEPEWSATLTVGTDETTVPVATGYSKWSVTGAELSTDEFAFEGETYRVMFLFNLAEGLYFTLDKELPSDFTLRIGGSEYSGRDSSIGRSNWEGNYWWGDRGFSWTPGETVEVSLSMNLAPLPARGDALPSAYFTYMPDVHNGDDSFQFRFNITQPVDLTDVNLRDHALVVDGGSVSNVEALGGGRWLITVEPDSSDNVTISLYEAADCQEPGAICTVGGASLYYYPVLTVPGLLLPDLVSYQHDYSVADVVATPDGAEFFALRFAGFVTNLGDGPLDLRGNPQLADDADLTSHDVWQRALTIDGDWVNLTKPPIDFEVDDGHDHFHVMGIVEYSLWDTSGTVEISSGAKVGFCLIDVVERPDLHANPGPKRHEQWDPDNYYCQSGRPRAKILHMGISEGWQDIYSFSTTFQWIDVSDVRPGYYRIGQRADPDNVIVESDETNNGLALSQLLHVVPGYVARPETVSVEPDAAVRFKLSVDEYFDDTNLEDGSPRTRAHRIVTQPSHGSLDVGDTVTVIVDGATHQVFTDEWVTYTPDPGYAGVDSFTFVALDESRPRYPINPVVAKVTVLSAGKLGITGFPRIGEVLTATTTGIADADGFENASFSYQWIRNDGGADADITGATDSNYVLVDADWGSTIKVRVSFTDDAGYAWTLTSEATAQASGPPGVPELPVGTAVFIGGVDLEWDDVIWADSYDVQLFRNGQWTDLPADDVAIAFYGAGAIISGLDPESSLWFRVRAENAHSISDWSEMLYMASTSQFKEGKKARPPNRTASGAPLINGAAQVGETLRVDPTGIEDQDGLDRVQFHYQWTANDGSADADITGATGSSYILVADDEGKTISVRVSFTDRGGYEESLTSAVTFAVP